jgi:heme/copper-type cytochrome/quinol oxidase subunit 3
MLALPAPPPVVRRRQLLVGTAYAVAAGTMAVGGLLAVYMTERELTNGGVGNTTKWVPKGVVINEVAANTILVTMFAASVMMQWAVYATKHGDRRHAAYGLGLSSVFGLAVLTAQARIWQDLQMVASKGVYQTIVYAITAVYAVLVASGVLVTAAAAFRVLGGRLAGSDREVVTAAAMWWHFLTAASVAVWFFVYVVK